MKKVYGIVVDANMSYESFNAKAFDLKRADADRIAIISIAPYDAKLQRPDFAKWERAAFAKEAAYAVQVPGLGDPAIVDVTIVP